MEGNFQNPFLNKSIDFIDRAKFPVAKIVGITGLTIGSLSTVAGVGLIDDDPKEAGKAFAGAGSAIFLGVGSWMFVKYAREGFSEKELVRKEKALQFASNNPEHGEKNTNEIIMEPDQPIYPIIP